MIGKTGHCFYNQPDLWEFPAWGGENAAEIQKCSDFRAGTLVYCIRTNSDLTRAAAAWPRFISDKSTLTRWLLKAAYRHGQHEGYPRWSRRVAWALYVADKSHKTRSGKHNVTELSWHGLVGWLWQHAKMSDKYSKTVLADKRNNALMKFRNNKWPARATRPRWNSGIARPSWQTRA